jgi:hypothetical protein
LRRSLKALQVRRIEQTSKSKFVHFIRITHRDEVESPITDWLREAYEVSNVLATGALPAPAASERNKSAKKRKAGASRRKLAARK